MELDAKTVAIIVGAIAAAVTILGKIADKLLDVVSTLIKDRKAPLPSSGNGNGAAKTNAEVLILKLDQLTTALGENTLVAREVAKGNMELKASLAQGMATLCQKVENTHEAVTAHVAQVREFEARIVGDVKDSRDQVLGTLRAKGAA